MIKTVCPECKRIFDMFNKLDVEEWSFGHPLKTIDVS